jgi:two-component system, chemotaxis family, CheB/CheR fusion protein
VATESRDYARAVIETVRSPLLELDAGLRVRVANPCFYATFETTPEEVVGHSLLDLAETTAGSDAGRQLAALLADGREIHDFEIDLRTNGGLVRKLVCDAREVRGGSAGERRILVGLRDVTAERTLADALRERGEALAAADRAKDAFLAGLSHELRTPLAAIIGWSQHILEGNLSADEELAAMQSILRNALAELQLVGDLLDVSRALNGTLTLAVRPTRLRKVLVDARDAVAAAARTTSITIELLAPAGLPEIAADPDRMRQVITNLLTNAVRFTPEGGWIRVKLRATKSEQVITVTDNGAGITAEQLPHVFERYYQATPDGKTGLGLGLSLVRDIVALHGGTVEAASDGPGKGATFTVRLPLAPREASVAQ